MLLIFLSHYLECFFKFMFLSYIIYINIFLKLQG